MLHKSPREFLFRAYTFISFFRILARFSFVWVFFSILPQTLNENVASRNPFDVCISVYCAASYQNDNYLQTYGFLLMLIDFRGRQNTYRVPKLCLQGDGEQLGVLLWRFHRLLHPLVAKSPATAHFFFDCICFTFILSSSVALKTSSAAIYSKNASASISLTSSRFTFLKIFLHASLNGLSRVVSLALTVVMVAGQQSLYINVS